MQYILKHAVVQIFILNIIKLYSKMFLKNIETANI